MLLQNLILMGIFFTIPPVPPGGAGARRPGDRGANAAASAGLFLSALAGSVLAKRFAPRGLVRVGLAIVFLSTLMLLRDDRTRARQQGLSRRDGVLGIGMGWSSQLANVVEVLDRRRGPQRGRQPPEHRPAARLLARHRASRAVVITGLITAFSANVGSASGS